MHVEYHPLECAKFKGTIPPSNWGAGTVMVCDYGNGSWLLNASGEGKYAPAL